MSARFCERSLAFAVDALVTTERHSPEFAGTLAKSASGGLEHVPICSVTNLARALVEMGDMGYSADRARFRRLDPLTGADLGARARWPWSSAPRYKGLAAADARAMRSAGCSSDLPGAIKSLNVSNACAIALALVHERISVQA